MRRMSKLASILDTSILADDKGNIEAKKDVKIDGNLKFKSLVSGDNPEGIFDPSSGGAGGGGSTTLYQHFVIMSSSKSEIEFNYYTTTDTHLKTLDDLLQLLKRTNIQCIGYINNSSSDKWIIRYLALESESEKVFKAYSNKIPDLTSSGIYLGANSGYTITDTSTPVN